MNEKGRKPMRNSQRTNPEAKDKQKNPAKKSTTGRQQKRVKTKDRLNTFSTIYDRQNKLLSIPQEWDYLIELIISSKISEETCFQACISAYIYGLIWQEYRGGQQVKPDYPQNQEERQNPMRPELKRQIEEIIEINEKRNGDLKRSKKVIGSQQNPDKLAKRLERCEIRDFMQFLYQNKQELQPDRIWRETMCQFFTEQLNNAPVYEACIECFRAGVIWQMNRRKFER